MEILSETTNQEILYIPFCLIHIHYFSQVHHLMNYEFKSFSAVWADRSICGTLPFAWFSLSLSTISDQTRASITPLQTFGLTRMSHRACTACRHLMPGTQSPVSHQAWRHLPQRQAAKQRVPLERDTKACSALTSSSTIPILPCSSIISTCSSFIITNSNNFYSTNNRSVAKVKA